MATEPQSIPQQLDAYITFVNNMEAFMFREHCIKLNGERWAEEWKRRG